MRYRLILICLLLPSGAFAQPAAVAVHVGYDVYAAGLPVAHVDAEFGIDGSRYTANLAYHTTGMVGFFYRGAQSDTVSGTWSGDVAVPAQFIGQGYWRGRDRLGLIDYDLGDPVVRRLVPPNDAEREPVPDTLRSHSMDSLSAMMTLIRRVADNGRCEADVRTYDGRRAVEIAAHTAGEQALEPTDRSAFSGRALRCDFEGRMLAGFRFDDNRVRDSSPMHGTAWLARVPAATPPLPVRLMFVTRWFGDATMYLTSVGPGSAAQVATRSSALCSDTPPHHIFVHNETYVKTKIVDI